MAKVKTAPGFVGQFKAALADGLKSVGIDAEIEVKPVPRTRLYRVLVLAPKFKALKPSERQNLVWRIADRALSPEDQLRISMILTLTNDEARGE